MRHRKSRSADPVYHALKKRQATVLFLDKNAEGVLFMRLPKGTSSSEIMDTVTETLKLLQREDIPGVSVVGMEEDVDFDMLTDKRLAEIGFARTCRKHDA